MNNRHEHKAIGKDKWIYLAPFREKQRYRTAWSTESYATFSLRKKETAGLPKAYTYTDHCRTEMIRSMQPRPDRKSVWFSRVLPWQTLDNRWRTKSANCLTATVTRLIFLWLSRQDLWHFLQVGMITDLCNLLSICPFPMYIPRSFVNPNAETSLPSLKKDGNNSSGSPALCHLRKPTSVITSLLMEDWYISVLIYSTFVSW